jgi:hypothetical protein
MNLKQGAGFSGYTFSGGRGKADMTDMETQFAADLAAMIDDLKVAVIFGGKTIDGSTSVLAATEIAAAAGELAGYRLSVYVVTADWAVAPAVTAPAVGDLLNVGGVDYRVLRLNSDCVGMRYDLGEKYTERV